MPEYTLEIDGRIAAVQITHRIMKVWIRHEIPRVDILKIEPYEKRTVGGRNLKERQATQKFADEIQVFIMTNRSYLGNFIKQGGISWNKQFRAGH